MKRRIAIFVFYDKDNIVDEYVYFFLKEIKKVVDCLVVICNGNIADEDNQRMGKYADKIIERENVGYDAGAIKDAILHYIGFDELRNYDELLITNDTVYGPLYPLHEVFKKMERKNVDFWGITQTSEPRYLHSYFLVVREKMLHSADFQYFWEQMKYYNYFGDVLYFYERRFTSFFEERGYSWECYTKIDKYKSCGYDVFPNPFYESFDEALKSDGSMPFLKRKPMANKKLFQSDHGGILFENYIAAMRSVKEQKYFDFNMVWDNLLRVYSLHDIQKGCNLTYVLETDKRNTPYMHDVLLVVKVETELFLSELIEKCNDIVKTADVWMIVDSFLLQKLKVELSSAVRVIAFDKKAYDMTGSFIMGSDIKYQYVCWLDTRDFMQDNLSYDEIKTRFCCYIDNLSNGKEYVARVHDLLKNEERLGMLFPPQVFEKQMFEMKENGGQIQNYCKQLGISVPLSERNFFVNKIYSFWARRELINEFAELWKRSSICFEDLGDACIGEVIAYYAQTRGYYTGIVKRKEYAIVDAAMKEEYLLELVGLLRNVSEKETYFEQRRMLKNKLLAASKFIKQHDRVYIYGIGEIGKLLASLLPGVHCFLVSDGQLKGDKLYNIPILYFSEYKWEIGDGIILAMNPENSKQVLELFQKKKVKADYFLYSL